MDEETLEPQIENVMNNFMQCSHMMFGPRGLYGVSYK